MRFSPSTLGMFKECPRCFFLEKHRNIKQPRGIFPSLPGGMDRIFKTWYDNHRSVGTLPAEIRGQMPPGQLFSDLATLGKMRNWRTGLSCTVDGIEIGGALDDLYIEASGLHSPFDYKTRGSAPKADAPDYYGHQLDIYALMLQENGYAISEKAYLAYYWPMALREDDKDGFCKTFFECSVQVKSTDPARAVALAIAARKCLTDGVEPEANPFCPYCTYAVAMAQPAAA
jgi:hypothetical protein